MNKLDSLINIIEQLAVEAKNNNSSWDTPMTEKEKELLTELQQMEQASR